MTTFLIIFTALYIGFSLLVANKAHSYDRNSGKWFVVALAINPLVAFALLSSRITESERNELPTNTFNWFGQKLAPAAA